MYKFIKIVAKEFTLGEISFVTAISCAFTDSAVAYFGTVIWFAVSSTNFAYATWRAKD